MKSQEGLKIDRRSESSSRRENGGCKPGTLYGIGVGPGDPELMTLKAARLLRSCRAVAAPRSGMAKRIAAAWLHPQRVEIDLPLPCGSDAPRRAAVYAAAAAAIETHLEAGRDVAALCEGDPMLYGSFLGLLEAFGDRKEKRKGRGEREYDVAIVPGVSSPAAAAAAARLGAARGDRGFVILPATLDDEGLRRRLSLGDGAAIVKLGRHLGRIRALLDAVGRSRNAVFVAHVSTPDEIVTPLDDATGAQAPYFSLILAPPLPNGDA